MHGRALRVPVTEDEPRTAYGEYGTGKAEIEALLHRETQAAASRPWCCTPVTSAGLAGRSSPLPGTSTRRVDCPGDGRPLALPDHGLGVLHHVHADDVAQAFELALSRPAAIGGSFHVAAEQAMTQRGLAAGAAQWFGREPVLNFVDWDEYTRRAGPEHAEVTREHTSRSITASIARACEVLGYAPGTPRWTPYTRHWHGSSPTARQTSTASRSPASNAPAEVARLRRSGACSRGGRWA